MISEPGYSPEQPGEALGAFGGGGFPPDGGAGGAALLRDPLIGPTGPPMEHHPGMLLQSGYRQYDQVLLNAGYQPPPPPPAAGAVAVPAAQSYMRDLAVETAAQSAQMGAAAVAGRVSLGLVARAMAQSAPALAGVPLYAGALQGVAQAASTVASASAGAVVRNTFNRKPPPGAGAAAVAALPGGLGVAEVRQMFEPAQRTPIERQFVAKGVPRDGAAVLAMQKKHDLSGGSAPHLDFRSLNGYNDGYAPMDRVLKPHANIAPYAMPKQRMATVMGYAPKPNDTKNGADNVVMSTSAASDDRPPPPPPGAAKIRRTQNVLAPLFPPDTPYGQILAARQLAEPASDMAQEKFARERSPPRGDRRPLSKRNASREKRASAGGVDGQTYGQVRDKALAQRSKTVPAEVFIGDKPARARGPPNAAQLKRRNARAAATKRMASEPAEDRRVKVRGGLADAGAERRQKLAANTNLYEDKSGNIKSKRAKTVANSSAAKTTKSKTTGAKGRFSKQSEPDISLLRPEDRYGVRQRRAKSVTSRSASGSASRPRGVVV